MVDFNILDVQGDGSCFYGAFFHACYNIQSVMKNDLNFEKMVGPSNLNTMVGTSMKPVTIKKFKECVFEVLGSCSWSGQTAYDRVDTETNEYVQSFHSMVIDDMEEIATRYGSVYESYIKAIIGIFKIGMDIRQRIKYSNGNGILNEMPAIDMQQLIVFNNTYIKSRGKLNKGGLPFPSCVRVDTSKYTLNKLQEVITEMACAKQTHAFHLSCNLINILNNSWYQLLQEYKLVMTLRSSPVTENFIDMISRVVKCNITVLKKVPTSTVTNDRRVEVFQRFIYNIKCPCVYVLFIPSELSYDNGHYNFVHVNDYKSLGVGPMYSAEFFDGINMENIACQVHPGGDIPTDPLTTGTAVLCTRCGKEQRSVVDAKIDLY